MSGLRVGALWEPALDSEPLIPDKKKQADDSGSGQQSEEEGLRRVEFKESNFLDLALALQSHQLINFLLIQLVHGLVKCLICSKTHSIVDHLPMNLLIQ